MKKLILLLALLMSGFAFCDTQIADLEVTPISQFGKVSVEFNVEGDAVPSENSWWLTCTEVDSGKVYSTMQVSTVTDGRHRLEWDMAADGIQIDNKAVTFKVECLPTYLVIDLSGGASATSYPVTTLAAPPTGGWTDEYKTTKLVLRCIGAGSYKMNGSYDVTISKPFYMSVFEVTQKQYQLVTGSNPSESTGDARPVEKVSWEMFRGNSDWPSVTTVDANSFMGKIRAKAGLTLDLPTEAQWEYACRAGTTSKYNNGGDAEADLKTLGRYLSNQSDNRGGYSEHTKVGSYTPNAWGLYDMHGNVWEWCLDWYGDNLSSSTDPKGPASGSTRVLRGGGWSSDAAHSVSSYRHNNNPTYTYGNYGFRLACPVGLNSFAATESVPLVMTSIPGLRLTDLKVTPISPFGKVIVEFNVEGATVSSENPWWLTCTEVDSGKAYSTTQVATVTDGRRRLEWDMAADGIRLDNKAVTFKVEYQPTYLVIDLSGGTSATRYPVTTLAAPPEGGWTDEYKTTKLVLRVIESGSYRMNGSYDVTISQPFYMGVFEVTQKQYQLVTGSNPSESTGDARPVEKVSWNAIRGRSDAYNWPSVTTVDANSFMGKLRAKTGLSLDLPTEAQWEYACRAGTTSKYNNGGDSSADLKTLGRYIDNRNDGRGGYSSHTKVGSYTPNAWGLYDMHGNVWEWCLDWYGNLSSSTDPKGPTSGSSRVTRGGGWDDGAGYCTSLERYNYYTPLSSIRDIGFRLACPAGL